jgi:hypothetical protein
MDIVSKINGNTLSATEFNQIPTELEAGITASGQTPSDAILNQVPIFVSRFAANNFYIDSGAANAYVLTLAASMTNPVSVVAGQGYFVGMTIRFRAGNANTGASTVNVNSAGVKNLKQADGTTDLAAGDIPTTQDSVFRYDGTSFVLQTGIASTTAKGIVELLTNAELAAGTDTTRAATAAAIASLFGTSDRSTTGYARLPVKVGGAFVEIIMQWGYVLAASIPTPGTNYTVTFPISFPNACLHVNYIGQGTYNAASTANDIVISKSTPSFVLSHGFASPRDVMWFSAGY